LIRIALFSNYARIEHTYQLEDYHDQVKRYNVRQTIDQQEISGFFELVKADE
jgi:hypothetical protein